MGPRPNRHPVGVACVLGGNRAARVQHDPCALGGRGSGGCARRRDHRRRRELVAGVIARVVRRQSVDVREGSNGGSGYRLLRKSAATATAVSQRRRPGVVGAGPPATPDSSRSGWASPTTPAAICIGRRAHRRASTCTGNCARTRRPSVAVGGRAGSSEDLSGQLEVLDRVALDAAERGRGDRRREKRRQCDATGPHGELPHDAAAATGRRRHLGTRRTA